MRVVHSCCASFGLFLWMHLHLSSCFLESQDTRSCGEQASPHVVIDVVIYDRGGCETKSPGRWLDRPARAGVVVAVRLEQLQFLGPVNRCPTAVDSELVVDVFGVGSQGIQRHHELAGDVWATQVGSEQSQHVKFTFA